VQFRSAANGPAQGRTANGLTATRTTDVTQGGACHSEGGVCVTSIQGGVQRCNGFLLQYDVSAGLKHKTARSEERIMSATSPQGQPP
jgi:hypothetical protein